METDEVQKCAQWHQNTFHSGICPDKVSNSTLLYFLNLQETSLPRMSRKSAEKFPGGKVFTVWRGRDHTCMGNIEVTRIRSI